MISLWHGCREASRRMLSTAKTRFRWESNGLRDRPDFRPLRKVGLDGGYFFLGGTTASLNAFARRNFTTVLAGILMVSPV